MANSSSYSADGPNSYKAQHEGTIIEGVTRKGFRLGLGLGAANTVVGSHSDFGFATTFEIGYGVNNQLSINYLNNVNWEASNSNSGFSAVAFNYYLDNAVNTAYIMGGVGGAINDSIYRDSDIEVAGIIGVGYAMDKVEFELNAVLSESFNQDMNQVFFTVSYIFY